ncbi:putative Zinc finger, RING/FYVE/PHD-type [Helianthus annuus]|nr:putative Zinc finger, RING/FYVE/PHD-type [Helianthus annuus]
MTPEILGVHKGEKCPKRIVTCDYCEFPLPAIDLFEHQEVCGNRTELCHLCNRYIRLRERAAHEVACNGAPPEIPRFEEHPPPPTHTHTK